MTQLQLFPSDPLVLYEPNSNRPITQIQVSENKLEAENLMK